MTTRKSTGVINGWVLAEKELRKALAGCSRCDYDEAEGGLLDHCDKCCRNIATVAWRWANASGRLKARHGKGVIQK